MKPMTVVGPYESEGMIITDVQSIDAQTGVIVKHTLMLSSDMATFPLVGVSIISSAGVAPITYVGYAAWDYWRQFSRSLRQPYLQDAQKAWAEYNELNDLNGYESQSDIPWVETMEPMAVEDDE
jgi:hypothetical protein